MFHSSQISRVNQIKHCSILKVLKDDANHPREPFKIR